MEADPEASSSINCLGHRVLRACASQPACLSFSTPDTILFDIPLPSDKAQRLMISELLNVLGLVVSAGGAIGSIQTSSAIRDLESRTSDAEELLRGVTDDMTFIRAALETLVTFDKVEGDLYPVLRVRYASSEDHVKEFLQHPERYGGKPYPDVLSAIKEAKQAASVPVLLKTPEADLAAFSIPIRQLQEQDVFGAVPLETFNPATIAKLADFLSSVERTKEAGDRFDIQFEVED